MAYADYSDLVDLTEKLIAGMVKSIFGTYQVKYHPEGQEGPEWTLDFTPPFRRLRMFPDLEKALGEKLPKPTELGTEEARQRLDMLCAKNNVECASPRTAARLLDKVSHLLQLCIFFLTTYCIYVEHKLKIFMNPKNNVHFTTFFFSLLSQINLVGWRISGRNLCESHFYH